MPLVAVYLVFPSRSACSQASTIGRGVGKSGSPMLKVMMLSPAARFSAILAVMAWVADGVMLAMRLLSMVAAPSSSCVVSLLYRCGSSSQKAPQAPRFSASRSSRVFRKYRTMSMVTIAMSAK